MGRSVNDRDLYPVGRQLGDHRPVPYYRRWPTLRVADYQWHAACSNRGVGDILEMDSSVTKYITTYERLWYLTVDVNGGNRGDRYDEHMFETKEEAEEALKKLPSKDRRNLSVCWVERLLDRWVKVD